MSFYYVYRAHLNPGPPGLPFRAAIAAMFEGSTTAADDLAVAETLREWLGDLESMAGHATRAGWRAEDGGTLHVFETLAQIGAYEAGTTGAFVFGGADKDAPSFIVSPRHLGHGMDAFLIVRPGDE